MLKNDTPEKRHVPYGFIWKCPPGQPLNFVRKECCAKHVEKLSFNGVSLEQTKWSNKRRH